MSVHHQNTTCYISTHIVIISSCANHVISAIFYRGSLNIPIWIIRVCCDITIYSLQNPDFIGKGFDFNKDAGLFVCPAGHLAKRKSKKPDSHPGASVRMVYFFDVEKYKACPLREGCFKEGAKNKTYSVAIKSEEHLDQQTFQETEEFKRLARENYKIEAKNSELKNKHGYDQVSAAGLFGMQIQGKTTIFAVNLKRILKLLNVKE